MIKKIFVKTGLYRKREQGTASEIAPRKTRKPQRRTKLKTLPAPVIDQTAILLEEDEKKSLPALLNRVGKRLSNPWRKRSITDTLASREQDIHHRLEIAFEALHRQFDERERELEKKLAEAKTQYQSRLRRYKWLLIPTGVIAAASLVYIFYMMQLVGSAMTQMSGDITTMNSTVSSMNGNMSSMSYDTRYMASNLQNMNQSMGQLNRSLDHMDYNVSAMNQNVGSMSRSIAPIGNMAQPASSFMGAMKSFMPF